MLAVEILMQAIVVARAVLQQQGRRLDLPGVMAAREIGAVVGRKAGGDAQRGVPGVGDFGQRRIERRPQRRTTLGNG